MSFKPKEGTLERLAEWSMSRASRANWRVSDIDNKSLEMLAEWSDYWSSQGVIDESYQGMKDND